jgi:hypothetical protein
VHLGYDLAGRPANGCDAPGHAKLRVLLAVLMAFWSAGFVLACKLRPRCSWMSVTRTLASSGHPSTPCRSYHPPKSWDCTIMSFTSAVIQIQALIGAAGITSLHCSHCTCGNYHSGGRNNHTRWPPSHPRIYFQTLKLGDHWNAACHSDMTAPLQARSQFTVYHAH